MQMALDLEKVVILILAWWLLQLSSESSGQNLLNSIKCWLLLLIIGNTCLWFGVHSCGPILLSTEFSLTFCWDYLRQALLTAWFKILCSVGKRSGHIPYRDSKLTRILQHSLGGNARTAIICTLSPALTHVEQSRNTLYFATRAKEVTNNAQVNMVTTNPLLSFLSYVFIYHGKFLTIEWHFQSHVLHRLFRTSSLLNICKRK